MRTVNFKSTVFGIIVTAIIVCVLSACQLSINSSRSKLERGIDLGTVHIHVDTSDAPIQLASK